VRPLRSTTVAEILGGDEGRLAVERVEDRLDEEQVDPALDEAANLLRVGCAHVVEGDRTEGRVVDPRRERERDVERPERACDEASARLVGGLPRQAGALEVHVVDGVLEAVVGLTDARRREGVRGRDVGAGREVRAVDVEDEVGPRQVEQVGVAADVAGMVAEALAAVVGLVQAEPLEHRPPGAVENDDPLRQQLLETVPSAHLPPDTTTAPA
jgi:hypothetical protein